MTLSFTPNKRTNNSLAHHLKYWDLKDRVMYLREGGAELGFRLNPPSSTFMTESGYQRLYNDIKMVLHSIGVLARARVVMECLTDAPDLVREHFEQPLFSPALERRRNHKQKAWNERMENGELRKYNFYITLFVPGKKIKEGLSYTRDTFVALRDRIEEQGELLQRALRMAKLGPERMSDQDIFDAVWRHFNPAFALSPPRYDPISERQYLGEDALKRGPEVQLNTFSRQVIATEIDNTDHRVMQVGDHFMGTVSLQGTPKHVWIDMVREVGTELCKVGMEYRIVSDFRHEHEGNLKRGMEAAVRAFNSDKKGATVTDATSGSKEQRLVKGLEEMETSGDLPFTTGFGIIFYAKTAEEVKTYRATCVGALSRLGGKMIQAGTVENGPQFIRNLAPFAGGINANSFISLERDAADLVPMSAPWVGCKKPTSIFTTRWGTALGLDYFDPGLRNFNGVICGGSGSGKSVLASEVATDSLAQGEFVAIVDKGLSYLPLCELLSEGGTRAGKKSVDMISFEPGKTSINIFQLPEGQTQPPDEKKLAIVNLLESLLPEVAGDIVATRYSLLVSAVDQSYGFYIRTFNEDGQDVKRTEPFTLSQFVERLHKMKNVGERELPNEGKAYAQNLATQLSAFCGNSPYGKLLDRHTSSNMVLSGDFCYIDYGAIEKHPELTDIILLLINELIWQRVFRNPGRRSKAMFDEAWSLISHPKAKEIVIRGYREGRKYGLGTWAISQSVSDMASVPGILANTSIFLLGQGLNEGEQLHKMADFPLEASGMLSSLGLGVKNGREFLLGLRMADETSEGGFMGDVIRYTPDPYSYWLFSTKDTDKVLRNQYIDAHGALPGLEQLVRAFQV